MKKCICIETHDKKDINVTSIFKKDNSYNFYFNIFKIDNLTHIFVISDSYLDRCGNKIEKSYLYTTKQFYKYFTDDIKVIRKMKLDIIKKAGQF